MAELPTYQDELPAEQPAPHPGTRPLAIVLRAAPALWAKTCQRERGAAARHAEFKKSLAWLLDKEGYQIRVNSPASYYTRAGDIKGKIDLVAAINGQEVLALEVDFKANAASGWKLLGKRKQGLQVLLLAGFQSDPAVARATVDTWFTKPTFPWLTLATLPAPATTLPVNPRR